MFEELPGKIRILIGLGISGLLSLIGYGFRTLVVLQNRYEIIWSDDGWTYHFKWTGTVMIHPSFEFGTALMALGVGIFLATLLCVVCSHLRWFKRPKVLLCPS